MDLTLQNNPIIINNDKKILKISRIILQIKLYNIRKPFEDETYIDALDLKNCSFINFLA